VLYEKVEELIHPIQRERKLAMHWDGKPSHPETPHELYYNDLVALITPLYKTDQFNMPWWLQRHGLPVHISPRILPETALIFKISRAVIVIQSSCSQRNKFFNGTYARIQGLKMKIIRS
jgi:hypothetical protein